MAESRVSPETLYFEDYEPGLSMAGGAYAVTEGEILEFGRRFDPQPFHTDPGLAAESHFGGLVAPGCLTFCIRNALLHQLPATPALVAGLGVEELALPHPVRPGDVLSLRFTVLDRRRSTSKPDRGVVRLEYRVENQQGETVLSMRAGMLVRLRDPD
jgi:acyl dehydratase